MKKTATRGIEIRRGYPGWQPITWLLLLAFTLQSFVTETHIHALPATTASAIGAVFERASGADKSPLANDMATCPFCQAVSHAGVFFSSTAPELLLPIDWAECVAPCLIAIAGGSSTSHSWQSRAPPPH